MCCVTQFDNSFFIQPNPLKLNRESKEEQTKIEPQHNKLAKWKVQYFVYIQSMKEENSLPVVSASIIRADDPVLLQHISATNI